MNPYDEAIDDLPPAPAAAATSRYDALIDEDITQQRATLRTTALQAATQTPERAAQAQTYAKRFGLPPSIIESNFDVYRQRAKLDDVSEIGRDAPRLAEWLTKDPANAAVAQDDLSALAVFERTLGIGRNVVGAAAAGVAGFTQGAWGAIQAAAESADALQPDQAGAPWRDLGAFATASAAVAGHLAEKFRGSQTGAGFVEQSVYSGIESIGQMAPGIVAGVAVGPAALLGIAGLTTGGQSYSEARAQAVGVAPALGFGALQGAIEVATEYIPAVRLLGDLGAKAPLLTMLARQIAAEIPGEEIATVLQDLNAWAVLPANKDRPFADYLQERPSAAAATLISTIVAVGATTVTAHGTARMIEKLGEAATESKTLQRSPAAVEDLIASATKDGPTSHLYAPIDTFVEYWQGQGVDPAVMAAELTGDLAAYQTAVDTQQDLVIPTARYAVTLAATPHNAFFKDELRLAPGEMNAREAVAFEAAELAKATATPAPPTPAEQVETAVRTQLEAAGVPVATAARYASLYEATFGTLAERAGLDPLALYQRYGLTVARPDLPAAPISAAPAPTATFLGYQPTSEGGVEPLYNITGGSRDRSTVTGATLAAEGIALPETLPTLEDWQTTRRRTPPPTLVTATPDQPAGTPLPPLLARLMDAAPVEEPAAPVTPARDPDAPLDLTNVAAAAAAMRAEDPTIDRRAKDLGIRARSSRTPAPPRSGIVLDVLAVHRQTGDPHAAASASAIGDRLRDAQSEQPRADPGGLDEGRGDGDRAQPGRLPTPGFPALDETFDRRPVAETTARLTPEVSRELARVLDELETFPFTEKTWTWLGPTEGKTGNAAGGEANTTPASAGAAVYDDVLAFAPVNRHKGQPAKQSRGTRAAVQTAIRSLIETGDVKTNLAEGALRVAEHRAAGIYTDLSAPALAHRDGMVAPVAFTDALSDAIGQALDDAVDTGGDATFDVTEFDQRTLEELEAITDPTPQDGRDWIAAQREKAKAEDAQNAEELAAFGPPETVAAIQLTNPRGQAIILSRSTQERGQWQLTYIGADGVPSGHSNLPTLAQAYASARGIYGTKTYGPSHGGKDYLVTEVVHRRAAAVQEFNQSLFDAFMDSDVVGTAAAKPYRQPGIAGWFVKDASGSDVLVPDSAVDVDPDTGELQVRLPDAGAVREQEIATPQFEAPFSLTAEARVPKRVRETTLFQALFQGDPPTPFSFPRVAVGDLVSGLRVRGGPVPNTASIAASFTAYEVLPGLRAVRMADFTGAPDQTARTQALAAAIRASGEITALIVVEDRDGLYILEGGHRWDALAELGVESFPALVVRDSASFDEATDLAQRTDDLVETPVRKGRALGDVGSRRGERRGSLKIGPDRQMAITLFARADLSTFLHESAHFFLEVMTDLAARPEATPALQADLETLRAAYPDTAHTGPGFSVAQHEALARGFEQYLMAGHAPSVELQTAFSHFRAWLLGIYRSLTALKVTLTPEVRGVFDRMLATDRAIAEAEASSVVMPLFTTAESAGMSAAEFSLYGGTVTAASRTARETLERRLMGEVQRAQTATWKAQRATIEAAVTAEVHAQPVYQALAAMRRGTRPDGSPLVEGVLERPPMKLSNAAIVQQFGAARLAQLPTPAIYTVDGGLAPDLVAGVFGFSSGDELLTVVALAPPMATVIQQATDQRMLAEHGSLLLDGTLHLEAQAAVANEGREAVIRAEAAALSKLRRTVQPHVAALKTQARRAPARIAAAMPSAETLRTVARDRIAATVIQEIRPAVFWSAARRAAQQAIDGAARQDVDGAIVAKQQELVNLALYREALKVKADVDARVARVRAIDRAVLGLAGESYLDQVDGVMDRFEFATVSKKILTRRARIAQWIAALEAEGLPADQLPAEILDDARRVNYQQVTYAELVGVTDGIAQIVHLARLKNKLLKAADQREFQAVRDGLVASIRTQNTVTPIPRETRDESWRTVADWYASTARLSLLTSQLDGNQDGGPMWDAFTRPINAASDAEDARNRADGAAYHTILERHYPGREQLAFGETVWIPAIQDSLSKEGRLAVALNWGNQTSRDRVLADPVLNVDASQVQAILDTLDARDWQFVQDTWDFVNGYWSEIAAKQQRVTGLAPEKVEALEVTTTFGVLRGGYYPLAYDRDKSARAGQHEAATTAKLAVSAAYVHGSTARGHVETRRQHVSLPITLELSVMFHHVQQVIHDLTHHETLIDVTRILRDKQVADAIYQTRGRLVYEKLATLLQDIALGSTAGGARPSVTGTIATFLRERSQIAGMAWNLWTAIQQPLGVLNGMERVGPVWVARGMKRWLRDSASLVSTVDWIMSVSAMMRERAGNSTVDLRDVRQTLAAPGGWFDVLVRTVSQDRVTQQTLLDSYMLHIALAQRVADVPTWLGEYEKQMAANPADEARAIALADQAVIDSQGSGSIKDLAEVQRGGPVAKLFMTFASYSVTVLNASARRAGRTDFRSPASVLTFLGGMTLLHVLPAMLTEGLRCATGKNECEDPGAFIGKIGGEMLSGALNGVIYARELVGGARVLLGQDSGARGYEGPASSRPFQVFYQLMQQVHQGELDEGLGKALFATSGILLKYPAAQVQRSADGWAALSSGRTTNPAALLFGAPKKGQ